MTNQAILQVEDDEADAFLVRSAFSQAGIPIPVHVASDGQQAIDYLAGTGSFMNREQHPLPCLVLLDLKLPKKTGFEVLEYIRQESTLRNLVVIVFSSSTSSADVSAAYALGANSFVEKPGAYAYGRTLEMAKSLKGWWFTFNRFPPA